MGLKRKYYKIIVQPSILNGSENCATIGQEYVYDGTSGDAHVKTNNDNMQG